MYQSRKVDVPVTRTKEKVLKSLRLRDFSFYLGLKARQFRKQEINSIRKLTQKEASVFNGLRQMRQLRQFFGYIQKTQKTHISKKPSQLTQLTRIR